LDSNQDKEIQNPNSLPSYPSTNTNLRQVVSDIRTVSVPTDPLLAALAALAALTPDQRAALAVLLNTTAPTGAAPAPTLPAPQPAPRPAPTLPDDVLPWERPKTQESH
jgi:hypothetical protein